jgi:F-type H+-transporting ATPase subunit delta
VEDTRAARRYAQALFEVADANKLVSKVEEDLTDFSALLDSNAEFRSFYYAPNASAAEKIAVVNDIFTRSASPLSLQLYKLMITKGRGREIPAVKKEFTKIRQSHSGIVFAHVTSTVELSALEKQELLGKLGAILGKSVEADYSIDPRLLGGVKVVYENSSIDASLRGSLESLRQKLHHDVLKQA